MQTLLQSIGADFSYSPPHVPQMNRTSERLNRTLLNYARTMIIDSGLRKGIWAEAINYSAHLLNCVKFIESVGKTPFEIVTGHKPYLGLVVPFGSRCVFKNRKPGTDKLDERGIDGAIVGIDEDGRSYRILQLGTTIIHRVPDVTLKKPGQIYESLA